VEYRVGESSIIDHDVDRDDRRRCARGWHALSEGRSTMPFCDANEDFANCSLHTTMYVPHESRQHPREQSWEREDVDQVHEMVSEADGASARTSLQHQGTSKLARFFVLAARTESARETAKDSREATQRKSEGKSGDGHLICLC